MSNSTSNVKQPVDHSKRSHKQQNKKGVVQLRKMLAITLVLIVLAILSVSDGSLFSSLSDTEIHNPSINK
ncbi:MAG: hypothetical protein ABW148_02155 [Sedimenticola sp.]